MSLTWKDAATTVLAVLVASFSYLMINGLSLPYNWGFRVGTLVLLVLGMGMCALSSPSSGNGASSSLVVIASVLGVISLGLIIFSLVTGTKIAFMVAAGVIILLWLIATMRHLLGW